MADYYISFARSARKELESLSAKLVQRIFPTIEALARKPRPKGCKKLATERNLWRIRVGDRLTIIKKRLTSAPFVIEVRLTNRRNDPDECDITLRTWSEA